MQPHYTSQLFRWRQQLCKRAPTPTTFNAVVIAPEPASASPALREQAGVIEIEFAFVCRMRITGPVATSTVKALIAVLARSSLMCRRWPDWVGAAAATLMPLVEVIRAHVFAAERIHADDTIVPVLAKGKTRTGRLWTYVRDDRPFAGRDPPAAVFFYSRDRGGEHPEQHLAGFGGLMQADAYAGFNRLYEAARKPDPIIEVACWAHAMPVEQRRRARAAGSGRGAQELAGGCYLHANLHRQAQRRRSAGLARRYAGAARRIADLLPWQWCGSRRQAA